MKKQKKKQQKNKSRRNLILAGIVLALFIIFCICENWSRNVGTTESTPEETEEEVVSVEDRDGLEITESMKDEDEMNELYANYLVENPIDFLNGNEVELTITSIYDSPVMTIGSTDNGMWYYSLAFSDCSYCEYVLDGTIYICVAENGIETWYTESTDEDAFSIVQDLYEQTTDTMNLANVFAKIEEAPTCNYKTTYTVTGDEINVELDKFSLTITVNEEITNDMTEEEYEEYIARIEEKSAAMREALEENPDIMFETEEDEVCNVYLYMDSETENIRFVETEFGENGSAEIILRPTGHSFSMDDVDTETEMSTDISIAYNFLEELTARCA